ncbi:GNAT family N-acetyltransferase [Rhodococcus sp. T2V]|nr:GNAT family N-acetyltransferase [Rhodococcus sp. T2V]MDF3311116.1 GNAT family N-acetyltransferase [Rhodococcus sp. T2V]
MAELKRVYVFPAVRGTGVARALLRRLLEDSRRVGAVLAIAVK